MRRRPSPPGLVRAPLALLALLGAFVGICGLCGACDDGGPRPIPRAAPAPTEAAATGSPGAARRIESRRVELTPNDGPLREQLAAHARHAREAGLVPVAYTHAEWCGPCQAVARHANDPAMREAFVGTSIAGVDVDRWGRAELREAGMGDVLPTWHALDDGGDAAGPSVDSGAWAEDIPPNMAPVLAAFFGGLGVPR